MAKINISASYEVKFHRHKIGPKTRYSAGVVIGSTSYWSGNDHCSKKTAVFRLLEMIKKEDKHAKTITLSESGRTRVYS